VHYIIGTTILIPESELRQTSGPVDVTDLAARKPKRVKNLTPFQTNIMYSLGNIRKQGDSIVYMFHSEAGEVELGFPNTTAADRYISQLKGEQLPDYENWHRGRQD
jgi:hypothetical protein|tara:strand:- start:3507 stop:3824 length:318 start_codon:yes stop_codon:yes gene_type:complete